MNNNIIYFKDKLKEKENKSILEIMTSSIVVQDKNLFDLGLDFINLMDLPFGYLSSDSKKTPTIEHLLNNQLRQKIVVFNNEDNSSQINLYYARNQIPWMIYNKQIIKGNFPETYIKTLKFLNSNLKEENKKDISLIEEKLLNQHNIKMSNLLWSSKKFTLFENKIVKKFQNIEFINILTRDGAYFGFSSPLSFENEEHTNSTINAIKLIENY